MSIKTNVLTTCEYEICAQGVTNELTTGHLANQLTYPTYLFVLTLSWSGGYTYDDVISIYKRVFPTHMGDMQSFEEAMAWGAVTFVKYVIYVITPQTLYAGPNLQPIPPSQEDLL